MFDSKTIVTLKTAHILRLIQSAKEAGIEVILQIPTMMN